MAKTADIFDRQPPCDPQAEMGVLGSIVLLPSVVTDLAPILQPEDFYDEANAKIYRHMLALHETSRIDPTLLIDRLKTAGQYEAVGGMAYLSKVINAVPNAAHARYYAEIVAAKALARRVIVSATEILSDAYEPTTPVDELVRRVESAAANLAGRVTGGIQPISLYAAGQEVIAGLESPEAAATNNRAHWGVPLLDEKIGPVMAGQLCVIAARPGMGKTSLAQQVLIHSACRERACLMVSLEMTYGELATREICRLSRIDSRHVKDGTLTDEEKAKAKAAASSMDVPYWIWSPPKATLGTIRGVVLNAVAKHGVRLVAVDYYTLIDGPPGTRDDRREQLVAISRGLKSLAKEAGVPLLLLAQLNREAEGGNRGNGKPVSVEPTLKNLAECSAIEQDADMVVFIHRENPREDDRRKIITAKARGGPVGGLTLKWCGARTEFSEVEASDQPNYDPAFQDWNNT